MNICPRIHFVLKFQTQISHSNIMRLIRVNLELMSYLEEHIELGVTPQLDQQLPRSVQAFQVFDVRVTKEAYLKNRAEQSMECASSRRGSTVANVRGVSQVRGVSLQAQTKKMSDSPGISYQFNRATFQPSKRFQKMAHGFPVPGSAPDSAASPWADRRLPRPARAARSRRRRHDAPLPPPGLHSGSGRGTRSPPPTVETETRDDVPTNTSGSNTLYEELHSNSQRVIHKNKYCFLQSLLTEVRGLEGGLLPSLCFGREFGAAFGK